ncbi:extracellular solute-binding protein, partial [Escherichia sp. HC-CC]
MRNIVKQIEIHNQHGEISTLKLFNDVAHTTIAPTIGYAPVPGQLPQLGGGSIGMSRYSKKKKQVEQFFHWLYSDRTTTQLWKLPWNGSIADRGSD